MFNPPGKIISSCLYSFEEMDIYATAAIFREKRMDVSILNLLPLMSKYTDKI